MIEKRAYAQAFTYTTASVLLSVAALFAGLMIARRIFRHERSTYDLCGRR